jgi:prevent-host-death family protein
MTQVSLTQLKANLGKYVSMAGDQDILISKNGKVVAKLVTAKVDKVAAAEELLSMFPKGTKVDLDKIREERLAR